MALGHRGEGRVEIEIGWAPDMEPLRGADAPPNVEWSRFDRWTCPVCDDAVVRPRRPGRKRVYCTNACRQFAYRWRRDQLGIDQDDRPVERATTRDRHHAVRRSDDPVGRDIDGDGRRVTACGVMARRVGDDPAIHGHLRLLPDPSGASAASDDAGSAGVGTTRDGRPPARAPTPPRACRRCVELRALPTYALVDGLAAAAEYRAEHEIERRRGIARRQSTAQRRARRRQAVERAAAA